MSFTLNLGDCLDAKTGLASLATSTVDALVTDPPAGIGFMGNGWDGDRGGRSEWVAWMTLVMRECLRALKPGAHALVWALPRTSHWTATAIEDAGFEIRDVVTHHFGTGFPKSLDVSKAIDKAAGATRTVTGTAVYGDGHEQRSSESIGFGGSDPENDRRTVTAPATDAAKQWSGWGTALKPGSENWILARKPLIGTVATNVLEHGTGGLNVDACRIEGVPKAWPADARTPDRRRGEYRMGGASGAMVESAQGRWPANVILSHSAACEDGPCAEDCPARELDRQSGTLKSGAGQKSNRTSATWEGGALRPLGTEFAASEGGASRFFYCPKPSTAEREAGLLHLPRVSGADMVDRDEGAAALSSPRAGAGRTSTGRANFHPTVKSIALMTWLLKLVMPPRGTVIDPFAGSGTTGVAAYRLGHRFVGWEKSPEYHVLAMARIKAARGQLEIVA